jgi:prolyl 4-hydroxylase
METFIHTFQVDLDVCDALIQYHTDNTEYKSEGKVGDGTQILKNVKESIDVTYYNNSSHPAITDYFQSLQKGYDEYVQEFNLEFFNLGVENGGAIQYYPPGGGFKQWHCERTNITNSSRQLVYMTYLNDVFDAGGTEWINQHVRLDARKGLSVIWPSDFTHTHRGVVSPTQEKWIATGWFSYKT